MHQKTGLSHLLRIGYKKNWKAIFLLSFVFLAWMIGIEYWDFYESQEVYHTLINEIKLSKELPSPEDIKQIIATSGEYTMWLEKLSNSFAEHQILLPEECLEGTPQSFQDKLQQDVCSINEKAKLNHITLPAGFFLGLAPYKEVPPSLEKLTTLRTQEFLLTWFVNMLIEQPDLIINELVLEDKNLTIDATEQNILFSLGHLIISITTNESAFQKILNNITRSPYFFIIENLVIENSNKKGPLHLAEKEKIDSDIKPILGKEKITATLTLELLDIIL